jgi:hypothetical protein
MNGSQQFRKPAALALGQPIAIQLLDLEHLRPGLR